MLKGDFLYVASRVSFPQAAMTNHADWKPGFDLFLTSVSVSQTNLFYRQLKYRLQLSALPACLFVTNFNFKCEFQALTYNGK